MRIALVLALSTTLALAACGDDSDSSNAAEEYADTSVEQVLEDVDDAMSELESVRLSGEIVEDGGTLNLDVLISTSGDCEGSVGMEGGGSFELMQVDGVSYFKPDQQFWEAQAGSSAERLMDLAGDKWVTNSDDPSGFGELCDLDTFLESLETEPEDAEMDGTEEVDGTDTVRLTFTSEDGNDGVAFIAGDEPHRILRFDVDGEGQVDFTDFDEELSVEEPAAEDTFDLATLD